MLDDLAGKPFDVGDLVIYTTNARESGLNVAEVQQIKTVHSYTDRYGQPHYSSKVKLLPKNSDGSPKYHKEWDRERLTYVLTPNEIRRTSWVDYSPGKFYKI